jgi:hypothetical protein
MRSDLRFPLSSGHFERLEDSGAINALTVEIKVTDFEVERAKQAYIPLLKACYALANHEPVIFPDGYVPVGEIRVERAELDAASDSAEVAWAVANDVESLEAGIADPDAFGFVVQENSSNCALVCIRGTQIPREWVANFTAVPNPFSLARDFGLVHLGFERMQRSLRGTIARHLDGFGKDTRVTVVGHSVGGAIGMLTAVDIMRNLGRPNVDVCTFGSPRAGKTVFRHRFNSEIKRCYRVVNQGDVVPHVPSLITGWVHVGEEIDVDGNPENPHSLTSYLEGLRNLGTVREIPLEVTVPGETAPLVAESGRAATTPVLSVRVP